MLIQFLLLILGLSLLWGGGRAINPILILSGKGTGGQSYYHWPDSGFHWNFATRIRC